MFFKKKNQGDSHAQGQTPDHQKKKTGIDKLVMGAIVGAAVGSVIGIAANPKKQHKEKEPEQLNLLEDGNHEPSQATIPHTQNKNLKPQKKKGFFSKLFGFKKNKQELLKTIPAEPVEDDVEKQKE